MDARASAEASAPAIRTVGSHALGARALAAALHQAGRVTDG